MASGWLGDTLTVVCVTSAHQRCQRLHLIPRSRLLTMCARTHTHTYRSPQCCQSLTGTVNSHRPLQIIPSPPPFPPASGRLFAHSEGIWDVPVDLRPLSPPLSSGKVKEGSSARRRANPRDSILSSLAWRVNELLNNQEDEIRRLPFIFYPSSTSQSRQEKPTFTQSFKRVGSVDLRLGRVISEQRRT